jgi:hypothetical protein
VLTDDHARVNPAVWQAMAKYLEEARVIEMDYEKFNGDRGNYCLEPYHLLAYDPSVAACRRKNASSPSSALAS